MPIVNYSQWEKENEHLTPQVIEVLLSSDEHPIQEAMIYATKGKARHARSLNPKDLELLAVSFYERVPYKKVRYSGAHASTDGGVDVWLTRHDADVEIVQCKQLSAKVTREGMKTFVKTMRKVHAVMGYYWAPAGFSKPALDYAEGIAEVVLFYDAIRIEKEVHEIFYDEVQLAREKLMEYLRTIPPSDIDKSNQVEEHPIYRRVVNEQRKTQSVKNKKGWTVAQVAIIFGMMILACLSCYFLFAAIATGAR